jgi:hypothetical protein
MSEDNACRVWCLIDDEKRAFSVNAGLEWDVEELTKTIRQERPRLQAIDIVDIALWKVRLSYLISINVCAHLRSQLNDPIPVPDDNDHHTLPQLLSKPITSFSVKLSKCTQKLSDALPYRPENHLHIIVELSGKRIYGHLCMGD